jgi:hypothetical protein
MFLMLFLRRHVFDVMAQALLKAPGESLGDHGRARTKAKAKPKANANANDRANYSLIMAIEPLLPSSGQLAGPRSSRFSRISLGTFSAVILTRPLAAIGPLR